MCAGHGVGAGDVAPQHHRAALAVVDGAGVNAGARFHRHRGGLVQGLGVVKHAALDVGAALPVATHQHLASAGGAGSLEGGAPPERDVVAREQDAPALLGQAAGIDAAAVVDHAAPQLARGHGAQDDQAAFGLDGLPVVDQGLPLARTHADVGELVLRVELQLDQFAGGQGHFAFGRHDQPLVAHFGGHEGDVALELGAQFSFVDHAGSAAIALKREVAGHEAFVAYAVGGGNEAAHVHHAAAAKEHAVAIADDDLARRVDAAQDGAGLGAGDAVEGGAAGVVEEHMGIFAHVKALPVEHSTLAGLVDDHVGAAAVDGGTAGGHAAAGGQGVRRHGLGPERGGCGQDRPSQRHPQHQRPDLPGSTVRCGTDVDVGRYAHPPGFAPGGDDFRHHHHLLQGVAPNDFAGVVHGLFSLMLRGCARRSTTGGPCAGCRPGPGPWWCWRWGCCPCGGHRWRGCSSRQDPSS